MKMDGLETTSEIWKECYSQCFQEKRHYDLLSWSIGGAILAFTAYVTGLILDLPSEMNAWRAAYAASTIPLLAIWIWIYERNRVWGEVCNEVARDIERRFGVDGIQLRYMRAHLHKEIDRANTDLPEQLRKSPSELVPGVPHPIRMRAPSMHYALFLLALLAVVAPMAVALSGAAKSTAPVVQNEPKK